MEIHSERKKRLSLSLLFKIIKDTVWGFIDDSVMRLSASLAYATLFSIIPFLSLLVTVGVFFHMDLANQLYVQLQPIVGPEVTEAVMTSSASDAVTIGRNANTTIDGGVALGSNSVASVDKGVDGYNPSTKALTGSTWTSTVGSVSVGDAANDITRQITGVRSEERRVGKECASMCRSRWSPYH